MDPSLSHLPLASDAVSVAGVHATIIAIFTAVLGGYLGIVWERMHSLRQQVIDQANSVGGVRLMRSYKHEALKEEGYDSRDASARSQHVANVNAIAKGQPAWLVGSQEGEANRAVDSRVPPLDDTTARVNYLVATLSLLRRTYPLHGARLESLREMRPWLSDALDVLRRTTASLTFTKGYVETIVAKAEADWKENTDEANAGLRKEGKQGTPEAALLEFAAQVTHPRLQLDELSGELSDLLLKVESIGGEVDRYEANVSRLPSRRQTIVVFAVTALAFAAGVVLPLVDTSAPRWIYVGWPCAIYLCGMTAAAAYIWRASRLPGT